MFAKGPQAGYSPKVEALKLLPAGAKCEQREGLGIRGYVVVLADGRSIASAGTASQSWGNAYDWALRNPTKGA